MGMFAAWAACMQADGAVQQHGGQRWVAHGCMAWLHACKPGIPALVSSVCVLHGMACHGCTQAVVGTACVFALTSVGAHVRGVTSSTRCEADDKAASQGAGGVLLGGVQLEPRRRRRWQ
jgi:hypothetical protein